MFIIVYFYFCLLFLQFVKHCAKLLLLLFFLKLEHESILQKSIVVLEYMYVCSYIIKYTYEYIMLFCWELRSVLKFQKLFY